MNGGFLDVLSDALAGVRSSPGRTTLSALGIGLAIATVLLVTGIPAAGRAALDRRLSALGSDVLVAQASGVTGSRVRLPDEAAAMVRRIGPVTAAASVANLNEPVLRTRFADGNRTAGVAALAVQGDLLTAVRGRLARGAFLTPSSASFSGVVLGRTAAQWLGIDRIGGTGPIEILVGGRPFTVVGVLAAMPLNPELEQAVLIGDVSAREQLGWDGHPTVVYLRSIESQLGAVRGVLPRTLSPQLPGLITVSRPSDVLAAKQAANTAFSSLALGLAAVALVVGGIGVSNTMIVAVLERRREIGVRRALGATRRDITVLFLTEAVLLALTGAGGGVVLGVLGTVCWSLLHGWPVVTSLPAIGISLLGAALVGGLAGAYPALRAARLSPTEALASP